MNKCTYITDTPCHCAFFASSRCLIGLAFNTKIHDMVPADGTVVNNNIWKILWNMEKLFYCFFDRKNYFYPKPTKQQHSTKRNKRKSIKISKWEFWILFWGYLLHFKTFTISFYIRRWRLFYFFLINIHSWCIISHLNTEIKLYLHPPPRTGNYLNENDLSSFSKY